MCGIRAVIANAIPIAAAAAASTTPYVCESGLTDSISLSWESERKNSAIVFFRHICAWSNKMVFVPSLLFNDTPIFNFHCALFYTDSAVAVVSVFVVRLNKLHIFKYAFHLIPLTFSVSLALVHCLSGCRCCFDIYFNWINFSSFTVLLLFLARLLFPMHLNDPTRKWLRQLSFVDCFCFALSVRFKNEKSLLMFHLVFDFEMDLCSVKSCFLFQ